jgi:hypothetical protein
VLGLVPSTALAAERRPLLQMWRPFVAYQDATALVTPGSSGSSGVHAHWVQERLGRAETARRARGFYELLNSRRSIRQAAGQRRGRFETLELPQ